MILNYLKKIVIGSFLIYTFNIIAINFNVILPINVWTIGFVSFFDFIGLTVLIIIKTIGV